jgi:hypothetical protein
MIATIHLNSDPGYTPSFESVDYLFTDYMKSRYDGNGTAVVRYSDGTGWGVHDMCHCSCYGPFERWAPEVYDTWLLCKQGLTGHDNLIARIEEYFVNVGEPLSL